MRIISDISTISDIVLSLQQLILEVNCRREHGAEGSEHLQYIEKELKAIYKLAEIESKIQTYNEDIRQVLSSNILKGALAREDSKSEANINLSVPRFFDLVARPDAKTESEKPAVDNRAACLEANVEWLVEEVKRLDRRIQIKNGGGE